MYKTIYRLILIALTVFSGGAYFNNNAIIEDYHQSIKVQGKFNGLYHYGIGETPGKNQSWFVDLLENEKRYMISKIINRSSDIDGLQAQIPIGALVDIYVRPIDQIEEESDIFSITQIEFRGKKFINEKERDDLRRWNGIGGALGAIIFFTFFVISLLKNKN